MNLWPHQEQAVFDTFDAIGKGHKRICLTCPTGGGKTVIACELITAYAYQLKEKCVIYTNRRMLVEQLSKVLEKAGIGHGVRAAGHAEQLDKLVQVSSIQTEDARVNKGYVWDRHAAKLVIVDEAHLQTGPVVEKILAAHVAEGAVVVGLTATPIDIGNLYDHLVVAGTNSQLRDCGALVLARHYGPDEPDLAAWKKARKAAYQEGKDLTENDCRKVMMTPTIFARVGKEFLRLNPDRRPTLLFAPGVKESIWFAEQFSRAGIPAAHIDGQEVWCDGHLERTSAQARADILGQSRDGRIVVLCNRYVLREGVDAPWLSHGIFATVFGALQTYLQSGGRLLRSHPGIETLTIQDHGGNWHRHGSLNADRQWRLDATGTMISGVRADRLRQKKDKEPICCPECKLIIAGNHCVCGWERPVYHKASRPVVAMDGTLKEQAGDIYKPRRVTTLANGLKRWETMYYRSLKPSGHRSFAAAFALYAIEGLQRFKDYAYPDRSWPLMPIDEVDVYRLIHLVPRERLIQGEQHGEGQSEAQGTKAAAQAGGVSGSGPEHPGD